MTTVYIENLDEIKAKLNPEAVLELLQPGNKKRFGKELRSPCPVHGGDGAENFSLNVDTHNWMCHSNGCKGTNLVDLYAQSKKIQINIAAAKLAEKFSIPIKYKEAMVSNRNTSYSPESILTCWDKAQPQGKDTYFPKKRLQPPPIARFGSNPKGYTSTLIALKDVNDELKCLISLSSGGKFNFGNPKGAFALLGVINPDGEFYAGEGIATVQTAWEATQRKIPAVSCGTWSNILPVVTAIKSKYHNAKPIILIDCDGGGNGIKAAQMIAKAFPDATFRKPDFSQFINPNNENLADFNDLISVCNFPLEEVKRQLSIEFQIPEYEDLKEWSKENRQEILKENSNSSSNYLPIISIADRQKNHEAMLAKNRGKKYLGLKVKTIKEFNHDMLGIRGLQLLAAAPNVGKTSLTIQLALEVLSENPEACLVYVSLEMNEDSIFTKMNLYHSELNYKTYVLGSTQIEYETHHENLFTSEELRKMELAKNSITKYGYRLQIIDQKTCPNINSDTIIAHIENVKKETGCTRAIVIVDYLQVWPVPENKRFSSDIEADKWRIGEIKKISDALNIDNHDPLIVISESRKPSSSGEVWGGELSDVMGSARGTYTPDAVLLLSQLEEKTLGNLFKNSGIKDFENKENPNSKEVVESKPITDFLARHGMVFCGLKLPKCRDGMTRFNTILVFHFRRNKFEPINWLEIRRISSEDKKKNK